MVRAHAQTLINAAALAFATGMLNADTAAELPGPKDETTTYQHRFADLSIRLQPPSLEGQATAA